MFKTEDMNKCLHFPFWPTVGAGGVKGHVHGGTPNYWPI